MTTFFTDRDSVNLTSTAGGLQLARTVFVYFRVISGIVLLCGRRKTIHEITLNSTKFRKSDEGIHSAAISNDKYT